MDNTTKVALETIEMGKQALIFCPSKASAEKTAEEISLLTKVSDPYLLELENKVSRAVSTPTKQCKRLAKIIKKGIAFHHAGLANKQKDLIEDNFKSGKIKIICCTPTLAAGLSLPAFRVIIKSLKRFSGKWGMDWIPVLEYMQMSGRAGRPEYEKFGEAISIAKNEQDRDDIYQRYICGVPEDIYSKLAAEPVLRTYLLSLISSGIIRSEFEMKEFFKETFWAHQYQDFAELENIMDKMLNLLLEWDFVTDGNKDNGDKIESSTDNNNNNNNNNQKKKFSDFISADSLLSKVKKMPETLNKKTNHNLRDRQLRATLIGKRVSQLYLDPLTAKHLVDCLNRTVRCGCLNTFSYLQAISNTLEMRPQLQVKKREQDLVQEELLQNYNCLLQDEPAQFDYSYNMFMNSIKTAMFFEAWISESGEDFLLEKFNVRPGETRVKLEIADWLIYSSEELAKLLNLRENATELRKLRFRIKNGVKEELLTLLKLKGIGRKRARRLYNNGIKDMGDLKKIDLATLSQIIGKAVAADVKKQLGEEVEEVPAGRRKGQLGLGKYTK